MIWCKPGILLRIFLCCQSGNHPENNLAKIFNILNIKVVHQEKKKKTSLKEASENSTIKERQLDQCSFYKNVF
jgi:hypothetical protein